MAVLSGVTGGGERVREMVKKGLNMDHVWSHDLSLPIEQNTKWQCLPSITISH